jgi:hypothetical protein
VHESAPIKYSLLREHDGEDVLENGHGSSSSSSTSGLAPNFLSQMPLVLVNGVVEGVVDAVAPTEGNDNDNNKLNTEENNNLNKENNDTNDDHLDHPDKIHIPGNPRLEILLQEAFLQVKSL